MYFPIQYNAISIRSPQEAAISTKKLQQKTLVSPSEMNSAIKECISCSFQICFTWKFYDFYLIIIKHINMYICNAMGKLACILTHLEIN